ncbi:LptF/LptG family permease [Commensalibacter oyaizuii]|uniref:LptF/LptG family permease n=1 Tax=Commensalibacter oyaizuii TaxID=3043873 RepID=A0ABT6Q1M9_9PROT|nr:LptF/LptG family permease [Commensalibacter sp. TBRC 16381]MDI2091006.1 LptF/LptG family permease [Commensalibacter sp. TBRC 16381]
MQLKLLDHYFLAQAFPSFCISLGIILAALMLERLLVLLDLLAADGSPLGTFLGLLADLIPHYLGLAIPSALCVSVFLSIRQMSLNNEIDALLSSGVSLFRCARPYVIVGGIISFLCIILYGYVQPYARYDFRAAFFYASHAGWVPNIQSHMIIKPDDHLVMIVDKATKHGTHLSGIFIQQKTKNEKNQPVQHFIVAKEGEFHTAQNRAKVQLDLYNGQNLTLNPDDNNNITNFDKATKTLQQSHKRLSYRDRGTGERESTIKRELTITELYQQLQHHTSKISILDIKAEFHFRLVRSLSIICIPILATGLAITKKRKKSNLGFAIAAVALVGYDHIQQFGSDMVASGHYSALVALWLPLAVFFCICYTTLLLKNGLYAFYPSFLLNRSVKKIRK